jgi:nucleotide-binding universal stress UspA family protein
LRNLAEEGRAKMSVLIGYVPTNEGAVALEQAIAQATFRATSITVVNVALGSNFADVTFADEKDLDAVRRRLTEAGVEHSVKQIVGATDVAGEILALAESEGSDLIVVGLRRTSPFGMVLLGSNAQRIILTSLCPVLSVRPKPA